MYQKAESRQHKYQVEAPVLCLINKVRARKIEAINLSVKRNFN